MCGENVLAIKMKCTSPKCHHQWLYKGQRPIASCPKCHNNIKVPSVITVKHENDNGLQKESTTVPEADMNAAHDKAAGTKEVIDPATRNREADSIDPAIAAKAFELFENKWRPEKVVIKLKIHPRVVKSLYAEYLDIKGLGNLVALYERVGGVRVDNAIELDKVLTENQMPIEECIETAKKGRQLTIINQELEAKQTQLDFYKEETFKLVTKLPELRKEKEELIRELKVKTDESNKAEERLKFFGSKVDTIEKELLTSDVFKAGVLSVIEVIKSEKLWVPYLNLASSWLHYPDLPIYEREPKFVQSLITEACKIPYEKLRKLMQDSTNELA